jgi:hypothetical protein
MMMNAKPEELIADMQSAIDTLESRLTAEMQSAIDTLESRLTAEMQSAIDVLESRLNNQGYRLAAVEDQLTGVRDGLRDEQWRPNPRGNGDVGPEQSEGPFPCS